MNSQNLFSNSTERKENLPPSKNSPIDFSLTYDQYIILQHHLPKKYSLLEYKPGKRAQSGAAMKYSQDDAIIYVNQNQNFSRFSGNFENTDDLEGRSKRQRPKKVDRFLQSQIAQKGPKRNVSEKFNLNLDEEMIECYNILIQLKKHKSSYPFLQPVNPQLDGAYNYLDIIKEPMDLSTVENNLKNGEYQTASQFHGDLNKIWLNSYAYNQKTSPLYKLTIQVEKYYKNLMTNEGISKKDKIPMAKPKAGNNPKEIKQNKKDFLLGKNQQKDDQLNNKESQRKSISAGNQNGYGDQNEFLYDK